MRNVVLLLLAALAVGCANSEAPTTVLIDSGWRPLTISASARVQEIHATEVLVVMATGATLIDVRTPDERGRGPVEGEVWVPYEPKLLEKPSALEESDFVTRIAEHVSPEKMLILVCNKGVRSLHASRTLLAHGFTRVLNVTGGLRGNKKDPGWIAWGGLPPQMIADSTSR